MAAAVLLSGCVVNAPPEHSGAMFPEESGSLPFAERMTGEEFVAESRELIREFKLQLVAAGAVGWEDPEPEQYTLSKCEGERGAQFISTRVQERLAEPVAVEPILAAARDVFESRGYVQFKQKIAETQRSGKVLNQFAWIDAENGITVIAGTIEGDQVYVRMYTGCLPVDDYWSLASVANTELPTRTW
ncbi:DUF4853 domain-containing protein [Gulosibacter hominis]|uniref:DUF4853 domain-containing protein n=1 Tax=Gulosibacter hominis TaxID=2770504 RepID=UPI0019182020|nr:DUF4853 domain-containing protein [Gulosibacter hominis]